MDPDQEPRPLREEYADLVDLIPLDDQHAEEPVAHPLAGVRREIDRTFEELKPYLEAVRELLTARGYHRALGSWLHAARSTGLEARDQDDPLHWVGRELNRVGAGEDTELHRATVAVHDMEEKYVPLIRKLKMLLTLEARILGQEADGPR